MVHTLSGTSRSTKLKRNPNFATRGQSSPTVDIRMPGGSFQPKSRDGITPVAGSRQDTGKLCIRDNSTRMKTLSKRFLEAAESAEESDKWWLASPLKDIMLINCGIECIDDDAFETSCGSLYALDLSENLLSDIPEPIGSLKSLKKLILRKNPISEFPENFEFPSLLILSLGGTRLNKFPALKGCAGLKNLDVSSCGLHSLSSSGDDCDIWFPPTLEVLSIGDNKLTSLPDNIFDQICGSLREIDVSSNQLKNLPTSLKKAKMLKILNAKHNRIGEIKHFLPNNDVLTELLLGFNCIHSVAGAELARYPLLSVIDLSENGLKALPNEHELASMNELRELNLSNNGLVEIPPCLGYLKNLGNLMVGGNPVKGIRYAILSSGATKLKEYLRARSQPSALCGHEKKLSVSAMKSEYAGSEPRVLQKFLFEHEKVREALASAHRNGILSLAGLLDKDEIEGQAQLELLLKNLFSEDELSQDSRGHNQAPRPRPASRKALVKLDISGMSFSGVPKVFTADNGSDVGLVLASLHSLDLGSNMLRAFRGSDISSAPLLRELSLRRNCLHTFIPDQNLRHLVVLDIRQNALSEIPSDLSIMCPRIEELYLGFNSIMETSFEFSTFERLRTLDVSNCKLSSMPASILRTNSLEYINVENNDIMVIPPVIVSLPNLRTILVAGNPQRGIRPNIVAEGAVSVLAYLRQRWESTGIKNDDEKVQVMASTSKKDSTNISEAVEAKPTTGKFSCPVSVDENTYDQFNNSHLSEEKKHEDSMTINAATSALHSTNFGVTDTPVTEETNEEKLAAMTESIRRLEAELENFALSKTRILNVKRQLARERAAKNKLQNIFG